MWFFETELGEQSLEEKGVVQSLISQLQAHVSKQIGPIAKPDQIKIVDSLPKTRSGKIMRRLLRDIASGKITSGDTSTLEDASVLEKIRESAD